MEVTVKIFEAIDKLIGYAEEKLSLCERNASYARNTLLMVLGLESYEKSEAKYAGESVSALLGALNEIALSEGLYPEEDAEKKLDAVMGALMLPPAEVEKIFSEIYEHSPEEATQWLYDYSVAGDYVKKEKLDKNPRFSAKNGLIVTINKAKPEFRDPKKAVSGNSVKGGYPKCSICRENEGYHGRAKRTLRTVSLTFGNEKWFWQFSPYGYFYQHGIAVNETHTPMHVDEDTFYRLMDFVDAFPHYFIGCNAPLPRIGGSVLAHDHFQGGGEKLPLFLAGIAKTLVCDKYPDVKIGVLDWFGTCVRITGRNRASIAQVSEIIRKGWVSYTDEARGLIPEDQDGMHHAVSPTVIKTADGYEMNLILRSNITSKQYPDGVFHAHPEFHVIKKESIGLIEAQGLFILPGRLEQELEEVKEALLKGALPEELKDFRLLYDEIREKNTPHTKEGADEAMRDELASICERILKNTAVFETHQDTEKFLRGLGFYD